MKYEYKTISIDELIPPEIPVRSAVDENSLLELAESIRAMGLIQPLTVKQVGDRYEIIAGHRRYMACKIVQVQMIACQVVTDTEINLDLIKLDENTKREQLSYIDEAEWIRRLQDQLKLNNRELATLVNHSERWVQSRLDMLTFPKDILDAITTKGMSLAVGSQLALITDDEERRRLTHFALEDGVSANTARYWVQQWRTNAPLLTNDLSVPSKGNLPKAEGEFHYPCKTCGDSTPMSRVSTIMICSG
ncbi:MAG: ParB/RepB/Spo0J family partition protein, partial [Candidatus Kerfeldbacteria bacterium]|nr:ParB/RepB/Spo0J family partition protein [Candidatus Kerfeldbacteria bacterium]